jgi:hypothetical protein
MKVSWFCSSLSGAFLSCALLFAPAAPAQTPTSQCASYTVRQTAWDPALKTAWTDAQLVELCKGAEHSTEPATCFIELMSGKVKPAVGNRWSPTMALQLCRGAVHARARVTCYTHEINRGNSWGVALRTCVPPPTAELTPPAAVRSRT